MRLTSSLLKRGIQGLMYSGKHRLEKNITADVKLGAMKALVAEQRNMDVLSRPYLTEEEDQDHLRDMGVEAAERTRQVEERKEKNWIKHFYMESELEHLNVTKRWE